MSTPRIPAWDRQAALVGALAACISVASFLHYFQFGEILLYGDAVAHINIARKVFDSRTPGPLQLGTVWLPLPHLSMIPTLISDWMWRTGLGGSIPSMIAYVLGAVGIFRLTRDALPTSKQSTLAAWVAAIAFSANPNLIYLQSTAMTESLYLALFIWSIVYFVELIRNAPDSRAPAIKCGLCLLGACLTRYDGWLLAAAICGALIFVAMKENSPSLARRDLKMVFVLAATGPILWLVYNTAIYRNPLEFANGPYSAKAIEQRTATAGSPPHPGSGKPTVAALYFLKSAELNLAGSQWLQRLWVLFLLGGSLTCFSRSARRWPLFLLWIPLPFYALSIAYGGVPVFLPVWWPFSYYNVRYGIEMLPAFAVFSAIGIHFIVGKIRGAKIQIATHLMLVGFLVLNYGSIRHDPICFREARINSRTRIAVETQLADCLGKLPPSATFVMYLGDHVGALQQAGIRLRRVINEGNHRVWKQPYDPDGLWERALANPDQYAEYVVVFERDAVSTAVNKTNLTALKVIDVTGQRRALIYATHATGQ